MIRQLLFILSFCYITVNCVAQPGSIDPTFNPSDIGFGTGDGFNGAYIEGQVYVLKVMDNGKILAGGQFTSYNSMSRSHLTRINADGTHDTTFYRASSTMVGSDKVNAIAVQADGKILVGEGSGHWGFQNISKLIIRLNEDGSQDMTFNAPTDIGISYAVKHIFPQPDGKIIVVGNGVVRLNADGSVDPTFTGSGQVGFLPYADLQPDGKILIGGNFTNFQGSGLNRLVRLNTDGSLDLSFVAAPEIGTGENILLPDGKIVGPGTGGLIRLNTDGSLDASFSSPFASKLVLQSDGKILTMKNGVISRINSDGSADPSFIPTTTTATNINDIAVQPDNKCIVVGEFTTWNGVYCNRIVRLDNNGNRDFTFNSFSGFNQTPGTTVNAIIQQTDGKILVGGDFTLYNGVERKNIVRINPNGSIDNTFDPGTGFDDEVTCIALQSDGKIVVGGAFSEFNGTSTELIARLNIDGSFDGTFNTGGFLSSPINSIAIQTDGKIIAGGDFENYSGTSCKRIVRINTNGSIDNTFNIGTGFNIDGVKVVKLQPDGKILCGGEFTSYNGTSSKRIVRLNTDGTIDNTFALGTGFSTGTVYDIKLQQDGKIVVAGTFSSYNGTSIVRGVTRINTNGALDLTFTPNISTSYPFTPKAMEIQSDGKIVIGGSVFEGSDLFRISTDGTVDQTFTPLVTNSQVYAIELLSDGDFLVGGTIKEYNGIGRNRIARIQGGSGNCSAGFILSPDPNQQHNWFALNNCTGSGSLTYDWNWGDGSSNSTGPNPSHVYSTAGYYNICVTITDGNGCSDTYCDNSTYIYKTMDMITINVVDQLPTGINIAESNLLKIYPNPANNILTIETEGGSGTYQLNDITGKLVQQGSITATKQSIDISSLGKGIYILSLSDGEQQVNRKIVKE